MTIFDNRLFGFESVRSKILPFSYLQAIAFKTALKPQACDVHVQVCIPISSPTNRLFSELPTVYRNAEKIGLSWMEQHNFAIFRYI